MSAPARASNNCSGWLRLDELPWCAAVTYALIKAEKIVTARLTIKGVLGHRGVRLVSKESVDKYLTQLAEEQLADRDEPARRFAVGTAPLRKAGAAEQLDIGFEE